MTLDRIRRYPPRPPLTEDDLKLLSTSTDELTAEARKFSFDREKFKARLYKGERWQQLIQAHLYIDHVLTQLLVEALKRPNEIQASRLGFSQKLDLINALDLIPEDFIAPIQFINKLRNKIAHQLDFLISEKDDTDFANCTPKFLREELSEEKDRDGGPLKLHELLFGLVLMLEIFRQQNALNRIQSRKAMLRLRAVLDRTPGVIYRE
jgi:hypothetical protein